MGASFDCPCCGLSFAPREPILGGVAVCPHCTTRVIVDRALVEAARWRAGSAAPGPVGGSRFTFTCQRCDSILEAFSDQCGKQGRCPTCGGVFVIPQIDALTGLARGPAVVSGDDQLPTPMHAYATAGAKAPQIQRRPDGSQVIVCPRCGRAMPVEANLCAGCGLPFTIEGAEHSARPGHAGNSPATISLVLGVFAIPTFCFPIAGVAAIAFGVAGLLRAGAVSGRESGRNPAIAGIVLGAMSCGAWVYRSFM